MDLFDQPASAPGTPPPAGPLADRMRPRSLDEVVGQEHLLGPGRVLRTALEPVARLGAHVLGHPFEARQGVLSRRHAVHVRRPTLPW